MKAGARAMKAGAEGHVDDAMSLRAGAREASSSHANPAGLAAAVWSMIAVAPEALCGAGAECCFSADWAFASIARKDNTAQMVASRIIKIRTIQISVLAQLISKSPPATSRRKKSRPI